MGHFEDKMKEFNELYDTILPSESWKLMHESERRRRVVEFLSSNPLFADFECLDLFDNGHVILRIERNIPANERGLFLLELEAELKCHVEQGITVWLEPVGDKSKLRQLRGVEIKT